MTKEESEEVKNKKDAYKAVPLVEVLYGDVIKQTQKHTRTLSSLDKKELLDNLEKIQKEIVNLGIPIDKQLIIKNVIDSAIREVKKDEPNYSWIKAIILYRFYDCVRRFKCVDEVFEWELTRKILKILHKTDI